MFDLLRWLSTILFGGLLGGAIAFSWQRRGWLFQQKLRRQVARYEAQISLTREIFSLIDKRIYASRIYLVALQGKDREEIQKERQTYREVVADWNAKISGAVIFTKSTFNSSVAREIDTYFLPEFSLIDQKLRNIRQLQEAERPISIDQIDIIKGKLHLININARELMLKMDKMIYTSKEIVEERPIIKMSNIEDLSISYLVKSLFIPRK